MTEADCHPGGQREVLSCCVKAVNVWPGVVRHVPVKIISQGEPTLSQHPPVVELGVEMKDRNPPGVRTADRDKYYYQAQPHLPEDSPPSTEYEKSWELSASCREMSS